MKIGQGLDVHRFSEDPTRELWLGLVHLEGERGLDGHSDADVVTHALCDALLGAAGLGDLGRHFAATDERWRNVASRELLERVMALLAERSLTAESADVTIIAETPRLATKMGAMSEQLSAVVGTEVSVKATTTEGLGAIGRAEGIGAMAVVLVSELA